MLDTHGSCCHCVYVLYLYSYCLLRLPILGLYHTLVTSIGLISIWIFSCPLLQKPGWNKPHSYTFTPPEYLEYKRLPVEFYTGTFLVWTGGHMVQKFWGSVCTLGQAGSACLPFQGGMWTLVLHVSSPFLSGHYGFESFIALLTIWIYLQTLRVLQLSVWGCGSFYYSWPEHFTHGFILYA